MKGIDPRARAIAKTAARKEGMTLGEWLNRVILDDGDSPHSDEWERSLSDYPGFGGGGGNDDDDDALRRVVQRLTERLEAAEQRSTLAMTSVDQSVLALARRLEALEDAQDEDGGEAGEQVRRLRGQTDELLERIRKLERAGPGGGNADAVKAVETTVGKIAARLYETERDVRAELDNLAHKEERRRDHAERAVKTLAERVEEAEKRFRDEAAALREAGEARETRAGEALSSLQETARSLQSRLIAAESATHRAAEALTRSQESLDRRLREIEAKTGDTLGAEDIQRRFDALARELAEIVRETRADCARQVAQVAQGRPDEARFEKALEAAETRLARAEERQTGALTRIAEEVGRLSRAVDGRIAEAERRLEQKFSDSETRRDQREVRSDIEARLDRVRAENTAAVRRIGEQVARLGESLADRVQQAEQRSARAVEAAGEKMAEVVEKLETRRGANETDLDARIRASEERTAQRIEEAMKGVHARLDQARQETSDALSPVQRAMTALADRLEQIEGKRGERADDGKAGFEGVKPSRRDGKRGGGDGSDGKGPGDGVDKAADFDTPLPPPPGFAGDSFETGEDPGAARDSFVLDAEAPRPAAAERRRADTASLSAEAEPKAPRRPARPGATADPDFLAAARKTVRSNRGETSWDAPAEAAPRKGGKALLIGASVLGFVAVAAAAGMLALEAMNRQAPATAAARPANSAEALSTLFADTPAAPAGADEAAPAAADPAPASELAPETSTETEAAPEPQAALSEPVLQPAALSVPASIPVSVPTLEEAAAAGNAVARYQLALDRLEAGRSADAAALMRRAAEQGEPAAMRRFALMLQTGQGVPTDAAAARDWMVRAAEAGNVMAMHDAGGMFIAAGDAPEVQAQAARFFELGALHGVRDSQFNMGLLYQEGFGVPQSLADAYAWFSIAAASGDQDAARRASELRRELSPEQRSAADEVARGFTPRRGDPAAQGEYPPQPWENADAGALTARAQALLAELGYDPGPADGVMGERTRIAIVRYQSEAGLTPGSPVDADFVARLERAAAG
ncbi:MAG: peptidoglycan-binding protein [Oceanicaulis sp.]